MILYKELLNVQEEIIRLSSLRSLIRLVTSGSEESDIGDIRQALYHIEDSLDSIMNSLRDRYDDLWVATEKVKIDKSDSLLVTNEYVQPANLMLDKIMRKMT